MKQSQMFMSLGKLGFFEENLGRKKELLKRKIG